MKTGKTLVELATELQRRETAKADYICDTRRLSLEKATDAPNSPVALHMRDNGIDAAPMQLTPHAHRQVGARLGIPAKYYDRMRTEAPDLLCDNVNRWFAQSPEQRMVRTLDGEARAFLSDRYQRIDNFEVANAVLPVLLEHEVEIASCEVTDNRLYIKAVNTRVQAEVKQGDLVQAGVMISNSEIGAGALVVQPLVYRLVCLNGMVVNDSTFRQHHVGAQAKRDEAVYKMLSDETLRADDRAIMLKARDVVGAALGQAMLQQSVDKLIGSQADRIEGDVPKAVEVLGSTLGLTGGEQNGVLRHLIEGGDLNRFGMVQAITRFAQDVESYDRSTELEQAGGLVLDLPKSQWREVAMAA